MTVAENLLYIFLTFTNTDLQFPSFIQFCVRHQKAHRTKELLNVLHDPGGLEGVEEEEVAVGPLAVRDDLDDLLGEDSAGHGRGRARLPEEEGQDLLLDLTLGQLEALRDGPDQLAEKLQVGLLRLEAGGTTFAGLEVEEHLKVRKYVIIH